MKHKSIFKASFEESLNLEDDDFRKLNQKSYNSAEKYFQNGGPSFKFKLIYALLSLFCPIGLSFMFALMTKLAQEDNAKFGFQVLKIDFHPMLVFYILLAVWLLLIVLGKYFYQTFILVYRLQFHAQFTSILWVVIEFNLLFIPLLEPTLTSYGMGALLIFLVGLGVTMAKSQQRHLQALLYGVKSQPDFFEKSLKFIATYGLGLLGLGVLIRWFLKIFSVGLSDSLEQLGLIATWFILDIGVLAFFIFVLTSHFLPAYYKLKYPEEYRNWEGKTVEEWYGKKYLKRHKELLKKEKE